MSDALPRLHGRVAVVTGSTRRTGKAIAMRLAAAGACVVINGRNDPVRADAVVKEIETQHGRGRAAASIADITKPEQARVLIATAVGHFGGLDILVNNAAIRLSTELESITFDEWRLVLDTCLDGAFLCSQAAAPYLGRSGHGRIINIGGTAGHFGGRAHAHVVTAKAGLVGLTKALAHDLGPRGITVNCLAPGIMEDATDDPALVAHRRGGRTPDMLLAQRFGRVEDVVASVINLCGPAWDYLTGQTIHLNGGLFLGGA